MQLQHFLNRPPSRLMAAAAAAANKLQTRASIHRPPTALAPKCGKQFTKASGL